MSFTKNEIDEMLDTAGFLNDDIVNGFETFYKNIDEDKLKNSEKIVHETFYKLAKEFVDGNIHPVRFIDITVNTLNITKDILQCYCNNDDDNIDYYYKLIRKTRKMKKRLSKLLYKFNNNFIKEF